MKKIKKLFICHIILTTTSCNFFSQNQTDFDFSVDENYDENYDEFNKKQTYALSTNNICQSYLNPDIAFSKYNVNENFTTDTNYFLQPHGLTIDLYGNIYVADTGRHAIRKIDQSGKVTTFAGQPGQPGYLDGVSKKSYFNSPRALTIDKYSNIYVADTGNQLIRKIDLAGNVTTIAGQYCKQGTTENNNKINNTALFNNPTGIAIHERHDGKIDIYVANSGNLVVNKILAEGIVQQFGYIKNSNFNFTMTSTSESSSDNKYYSGFYNSGSEALNPYFGIAVDQDENIYISDNIYNKIYQLNINSNGVIIPTSDQNYLIENEYFISSLTYDLKNKNLYGTSINREKSWAFQILSDITNYMTIFISQTQNNENNLTGITVYYNNFYVSDSKTNKILIGSLDGDKKQSLKIFAQREN